MHINEIDPTEGVECKGNDLVPACTPSLHGVEFIFIKWENSSVLTNTN